MKKKFHVLLSLFVLASMLLGACQPAAPVVEEAEPEAAVEEAEAEEAEEVEEAEEAEAEEEMEEVEEEEPEVVEPAGPDALDAEFSAMLDAMAAYNTIKADALLEEMAADTPPFLLDVRTTAELEESGHIEGATHIPLNELAQHIDLLPDFDTPIVAYCGSGWRATIAMTALHGMGWTDVRTLKALYTDWVDAGNPVVEGVPEPMVLDVAQPDPTLVAAADAYLVDIKDHGVKFGITTAKDLNLAIGENPDLMVIDVRRQEEVDEKGYIDAPNWMHIPLEEFVARRADWPAQDASIVIYCGSGHRSTMAMTIMFAYGYTDVLSLKGGFNGWAEAGFPVVGGAAAEAPAFDETYATMLETMEAYNTIKADALLTEMVEDQPPFLLDVRTTAELEESGHIEGATHIPLSELAQHIDLLPGFDTPIVAYCGSGWRATIAMTALHGMGWTDVRALKALYSDWVEAGNPVVEGVPEPMVLDVAQPDPALVEAVDAALVDIKSLGAKFGIKTADELNADLAEKPDLILIDVRRTEELEEKGIIGVEGQTLLTIPLEEFMAQQDMWPESMDAEVVIYCGSGHRSTMAMTMMLSYGYTNVTSLKGGFGGWAEAGYPVAEFAAP